MQTAYSKLCNLFFLKCLPRIFPKYYRYEMQLLLCRRPLVCLLLSCFFLPLLPASSSPYFSGSSASNSDTEDNTLCDPSSATASPGILSSRLTSTPVHKDEGTLLDQSSPPTSPKNSTTVQSSSSSADFVDDSTKQVTKEHCSTSVEFETPSNKPEFHSSVIETKSSSRDDNLLNTESPSANCLLTGNY